MITFQRLRSCLFRCINIRRQVFFYYRIIIVCCLCEFAVDEAAAQSVVQSSSQQNVPCDTVQRVIVRDSTPPSYTRIGVMADYAVPIVNASFARLPGVPSCCPGYTFSSGLAFGGAVIGELQILPNIGIGANIRLGLSELQFSHRQYVPVANIPGLPILYSLKTNLISLGFEPYIFFRPFEAFSIQAGIGITSFLPSTFSAFEKIDTVGFAFFNNNAFNQVRNNARGNLSELNAALPTLRLGLSYEIPILVNKTLFFAPELSFALGVGDIIQQLQGESPRFAMSALRFGASLRYSPSPRLSSEDLLRLQERKDEQYRLRLEECKRINTPSPAKRVVRASITALQSVNPDGTIIENPTIRVEEFLASRSRYVLNTVFFASQAAEISSKYNTIQASETTSFRLEDFAASDVLQIYYQVLNIIGKRLVSNPRAEITLVGFADGLIEKNDKKLALQRAERVKMYLVNTWKIEEKRIKTQTGTSRIPLANDGDELLEAEEQRRVEIMSNTKAILEELRFDYTQQVVTPPNVRISFEVSSDAELKQWLIQGVQPLQQNTSKTESTTVFSVQGAVSPQEKFVTWDLSNPKYRPQSNQPITILCTAQDTEGGSASDKRAIPMQYIRIPDKEQQGLPDKRIDSYTLFSFAYGTNAPISGNADVQRVVAAIKQTLKPGAKVIVTGYTDTRGNEITNGILALQRANAVAGLIGFPNMQVNSEAGTKINDNSLPEGRFYNRFVQVDVQTPLR